MIHKLLKHRGLLGVLVLALLIRLWMLPFVGFFGDLHMYIYWGQVMSQHFWHFYSSMAPRADVADYPPLSSFLFSLQVWLYNTASMLFSRQSTATLDSSPLFMIWMKLPLVAADLATLVVLYRLARRWLPERQALLLVACYALLPPMVIEGALWGQIDGLFVLPLLLAAWATLRRRPVLVGFFLALACLIKPQPLFLVPLFLVWLARQQSFVALRKALVVFVGVSFLGWLPYLLPLSRQPEVFVFLQNMQSFSVWQGAHSATSNAYNFWWLFGPHITAIRPLVGPFSASVIGWVLYALAMLLALRGIWQDESDRQFWLSLTLLAVAFFVVTVGQHERYLYPALAFAFLAVSTQRRLFWIAAGLAVSFTINILLGILTGSPGSSALLVPVLVAWIRGHPAFHEILAGATACLNVVLLLNLAAIQIQRIRLHRLETAMSAQSPGELLRAGRTSGLH